MTDKAHKTQTKGLIKTFFYIYILKQLKSCKADIKKMGALIKIYFKAEILETLLKTVKAKGTKGVEITASINDDTDKFGQNVSAFVSQTKEENSQKKPRYYVGNGSVIWTSGSVVVPPKKDNTASANYA